MYVHACPPYLYCQSSCHVPIDFSFVVGGFFKAAINDVFNVVAYQGPINFGIQSESGWSGAYIPYVCLLES